MTRRGWIVVLTLVGAFALGVTPDGQARLQRGWSTVSGGLLTWPLGTLLSEDAANTLSQRGTTGTASQTLNIYRTFTDLSNYERLSIAPAAIAFQEAGTGGAYDSTILNSNGGHLTVGTTNTAGDLYFRSGGSDRFYILGSSGNLLAITDNTPNIGTRTNLRPAEVISASSMITGMVIANTSMQLGGVASNSSVALFTPVTNTTGGAQGIIIQQADGTPALFADLNGSATNGAIIYCSDCTIANPCATGGTGAIAKRLNGQWVCN